MWDFGETENKTHYTVCSIVTYVIKISFLVKPASVAFFYLDDSQEIGRYVSEKLLQDKKLLPSRTKTKHLTLKLV